MDTVLRIVAIYLFLVLIFRIAGRRALSESTTFDLMMVLIISETTQQAMIGEDHSITNAFLLIVSLVGLDVLISKLKQTSKWFDRVIDDEPVLIVDRGKLLEDRMHRLRIDREDILESARKVHGLERLDQIRYAVCERDGEISIIPEYLHRAASPWANGEGAS